MGISLSGLTESSTGHLTLSAGSGSDVLIGNGSTILRIDGGADGGAGTVGVGLGTTAQDNVVFILDDDRTWATSSPRILTVGGAQVMGDGAGQDFYFAQFGAGHSVTTQDNSETIVAVGTVWIREPIITKGSSDTITNAFTLKVESAPTEGANNYALWVDDGAVRFDDRTLTSTWNLDV